MMKSLRRWWGSRRLVGTVRLVIVAAMVSSGSAGLVGAADGVEEPKSIRKTCGMCPEGYATTGVTHAPELCKDALYEREERVKNLLRWDVAVPPNTFGEKAHAITYQFKMELDKQLQVGAITK